MIDRLFSATLLFSLLAGGTLAIGSELLGNKPAAAPARAEAHVVQLPMVIVTGKRLAATTSVAASDSTEPATARVE